MTLPVVFTANGPSGYNLTNSLRFRSSASAYLNRTQGTSTNQSIGTWSFWCKRGTLGTTQRLFEGYTASSDTGVMEFEFDTNNCFYIGGWATNWRITTQVFRDPSAWYHIVVAVDTTQATANNRIRVYVNGTEVTAFSTTNNPSQNSTFGLNNNSAVLQIGRRRNVSNNDQFFDGYLTEVNFIDGQALTPSSFGETSATTGVWIPKKYTGTYGTNGFYLPFTDNSALTTSSNVGLGKDFSGNSNYWTTNNISITSGATYDSMTDVPTLTSATTANYCVVNPLPPSTSGGSWYTQDGNLKLVRNGGGFITAVATMGVTSGKWYWEVIPQNSGNQFTIGIAKDGYDWTTYLGSNAFGWSYEGGSGVKYTNGSSSAYGATYTTNDVIGVAFDADAGTLTFYKNNTSQGQAFSGLTSGPYYPASGVSNLNTAAVFNFGQRPFAYTPPTGFVALNTFNLPTPTIGATASTTANKYFDATTYTGTGSSLAVTNSGSMQPDWVWVKSRSAASRNTIFDAVRGTNKIIWSDSGDAEGTANAGTGLTAFASNGFTLGTEVAGTSGSTNTNGTTYVAWQWRASNATAVTNTAGSITSTVSANTSAGFSIVTFTAPSSNQSFTVGHGLGVAPSMTIKKRRDSSVGGSWWTWHIGLGDNTTDYVALNTTDAESSVSNMWGTVGRTSTLLGFNVTASCVANETAVVYCFAQIAGYSAFGSYTGNGSTDGPFVYTGFRPRFIMFRSTSSPRDWCMIDTARQTNNANTLEYPAANLANAETTGGFEKDILSNGFKLRSATNNFNINGETYIYMAFAENPFKYSLAR